MQYYRCLHIVGMIYVTLANKHTAVTVGTKAKLFETLVIPVFLYGSEC